MRRRIVGTCSIRHPATGRRIKLELLPASDFGGPQDLYRVRIHRRYVDAPDGGPRFFDREALAALIRGCLLDGMESLPSAPAPRLPVGSRVTVRLPGADGMTRQEGAYTTSPPILDARGRWMVCVLARGMRDFVPVDDLQWREMTDARGGYDCK